MSGGGVDAGGGGSRSRKKGKRKNAEILLDYRLRYTSFGRLKTKS